MKKLFFIQVLSLSFIWTNAQNTAVKLLVNKSEMDAIQSIINYDVKIVKSALEQKFKDLGIKYSSSKGIYDFKQTALEEFNNEKMDLLISIETQGKAETPSIIKVVVIKDNEIIKVSDTSNLRKYSVFSDKFIDYVKGYKHKVDVENKKTEVANAQKELDKLVKEGESLNNSIQKNSKEIESNTKDQQLRKVDYESKKKAHDDFMGKTTLSEMNQLGINPKKKEQIVTDAQKDYDKSLKEGEKLLKEKDKLNSELAMNGKNQELKKKELEKLTKELDELNQTKP
jgi:hypothetical protein